MALSKPRPILQAMPPHIKKRISNNLLFKLDLMTLRNFNPEFRRVIGDPSFETKEVHLKFNCSPEQRIKLSVEDDREQHDIEFIKVAGGTEIVRDSRIFEKNHNFKVVVPGGNFIDLMTEAFGCLLDNPNFKVSTFEVTDYNHKPRSMYELPEFLNKIQHVLSHLNHKINARSIYIRSSAKHDNLLSIVPYFDTRYLYVNTSDHTLPIEQFWDFPVIEIVRRGTMLEDIQRLIQHYRCSSTLVECKLVTRFFQPQKFKDVIGESWAWQQSDHGIYVELPATETLGHVCVLLEYSGYVKFAKELERLLTGFPF